jgi:catechol 2,3-dioxygenase-like lactoylglutathione lyase family enzyme
MSIKRLHTFYVTASDVRACAHFYETALGLEVRFRDGDRWVQFALDGTSSFAVASCEEASAGAVGGTAVFEATEEVDHIRTVQAGAREIGERDMGAHGRTRTYADPAGNLLQLFWRA